MGKAQVIGSNRQCMGGHCVDCFIGIWCLTQVKLTGMTDCLNLTHRVRECGALQHQRAWRSDAG